MASVCTGVPASNLVRLDEGQENDAGGHELANHQITHFEMLGALAERSLGVDHLYRGFVVAVLLTRAINREAELAEQVAHALEVDRRLRRGDNLAATRRELNDRLQERA